MKTKEKILQAALRLYNSKGIYSITSRHIAASLKISPGNLHYHFKHTDEITKTLYDRLSAEFDGLMSQMEPIEAINMDTINDFSVRSFKLIYKYRFIFLHFVEIGWRIPVVRRDYYNLTKRRTKEFLTIFRQLVKNGTFRSDLPVNVWPALVTQIFVVGDFWLSNNELTNKFTGSEAVSHYSKTFHMMFLPYLAKK
jgi:AcrR family transcriptional regulator